MKRMLMLLVTFTLLFCLASPAFAGGKDASAPGVKGSNPSNNKIDFPIDQAVTITFDKNIFKGKTFTKITLTDSNGIKIKYKAEIDKNLLSIKAVADLKNDTGYTLNIPIGAIVNQSRISIRKSIVLHFTAAKARVAIPFSDKNLEKAIREIINKPEGDIYIDDVKSVETLDLREKNIADITPLQFFFGLKNLSLSYITSETSSNRNKIKDISALSKLSGLTQLDLTANEITDIGALSGLSNLTSLQLAVNKISDITSLKGHINLRNLALNKNNISDISMLKGLENLQILGITDNSITDISPLRDLKNLQYLFMNDNNISDISALSGLANLKSLYLAGNPIADFSPVEPYYSNLTVKDFEITDKKAAVGEIVGGTCRATYNFDLESGNEVENGYESDFWWERRTLINADIVPQNGAICVYTGKDFNFSVIDLDFFKNTHFEKFSGKAISDDKLGKGDIVLFKTQEGNYAKLVIEGIDDEYTLKFKYVLYDN